MTNPNLQTILEELREKLSALYGDRLATLVLYGSQARGDAEPDSDIDVLVVLKGDVDEPKEMDEVSELLSELSLKYDTVISGMFISEQRYLSHRSSLLLNVRREGVII